MTKTIRILFTIFCLPLLGWSPLAAAAGCNLRTIGEGMSAADWTADMMRLCDFANRAQQKLDETFPNQDRKLRMLTAGKILSLHEEGIDIIMIIGRSADFSKDEDFRKRDASAEILSFLRRFDNEKTIFIGGGTPTGDVGLFHEIAVKKGFRVMGITSSKAADGGAPALMTDLYAEPGKAYGVESNTALKMAKAVVMFSGGKQSAREGIKMAYVEHKPLYIIDSPRLGGKSAEVAAAFDNNPLVQVVTSAAEAADLIKSRVASNLPQLPKGGLDLTEAEAREVYHDMFFLGFSTWSENAPATEESIKTFKFFTIKLLERLDPKKVVVVVAGSQLHDKQGKIIDGEGFVIHEAKKRGFVILGTPAAEIKQEEFSTEIDKFIYTGPKWEARNQTFMRNLDGLITAGQSKTIINHMETAHDWNLPIFHLENFNKALDTFARNLSDDILINDESVDRVITALNQAAHNQGIGLIERRSCKASLNK